MTERSRHGRPERHSQGHQRGPYRGRDERRGGRRESRPRVSTSPRVAAFDVLMAVQESDSYANLLLPPLLRERRIFGRDAGFATELTYGTLRMQGRYDAILELAGDRKIRELDTGIAVALRLGVHQLLAMRVPDHAAVSETVGLAREKISAGPAQLVNAVLRRVSERSMDQWVEKIETDSQGGLAATHSHPDWVVRAFQQSLKSDVTQAEDPEASVIQLLTANNQPPVVHLAMRPGLSSDTDLSDIEVEPSNYARTARYLHGGDPGAIAALREGVIGVQDEGSQLVTLAALAAEVEGSDSTWLDLCAGPGGKAALMAAELADRGGGDFVANELHKHRTGLVKQNLKAVPASVNITTQTGDGSELGELEPGKYDRVLLDAPCTGLGALRRRPESRWRRSPSDLPGLTALQRSLLLSAIQSTRVGGVVAYITCSPHVAETQLVVQDAIRDAKKKEIEVEIIDAVPAINSISKQPVDSLHGPFVQLWPHLHGTDGMFLSLIRRTG